MGRSLKIVELSIVRSVLQILINFHHALFNVSIQFDLFCFVSLWRFVLLYKVFDTRSLDALSLNSSNLPFKFSYSVTQ